jgi:hypothetical protein
MLFSVSACLEHSRPVPFGLEHNLSLLSGPEHSHSQFPLDTMNRLLTVLTILSLGEATIKGHFSDI